MSEQTHPGSAVRVDPAPVAGHSSAGEPGPDLLSLASQLCFALYSTSRAMTAAYRPHLDAMGITYPQYLALLALWEQPDMTMKELGAKLSLDYGTVSPLIARLQANGLVDCVRSAKDRRAVRLRATEQGLALRDGARTMVDSVRGSAGYSLESLYALRDQINVLGQRLDEMNADRT
ncbi:MarR family winged helix-turn-helix transcriptional regulator [Nocardia callitridis]|uniref:MarR family transcriptional regulator n=1 Tax=Nocardia callitridis TaxID=648753 RepID=A0ABP9KMG1_9NOCA